MSIKLPRCTACSPIFMLHLCSSGEGWNYGSRDPGTRESAITLQLEEFRAKKLAGKPKPSSRAPASSSHADVTPEVPNTSPDEDAGVENRDPALPDAPAATAESTIVHRSAPAAQAVGAAPAQSSLAPVQSVAPASAVTGLITTDAGAEHEAGFLAPALPGVEDGGSEARHVSGQLKQENGQLRAQLALVESSQMAVHAQLEASKEQLSTIRSEHARAKQEWELELSSASAAKQSAVDDREAALQRAEHAETRLAGSMQNQTSAADAECRRLGSDLQAAQQQLSESVATADLLQQQLAEALSARDQAIAASAASVDQLQEKLEAAERDRDDLRDAMETAQEAHAMQTAELHSSHKDEQDALMERIRILEDEAHTASAAKVPFLLPITLQTVTSFTACLSPRVIGRIPIAA